MTGSIKNVKWGDPKTYNFVVNQDKDRKPMYMVSTEPKEELDKNILTRFKSMNIDMDVWMKGEDPFSDSKTDGVDGDKLADDVLEGIEALANE